MHGKPKITIRQGGLLKCCHGGSRHRGQAKADRRTHEKHRASEVPTPSATTRSGASDRKENACYESRLSRASLFQFLNSSRDRIRDLVPVCGVLCAVYDVSATRYTNMTLCFLVYTVDHSVATQWRYPEKRPGLWVSPSTYHASKTPSSSGNVYESEARQVLAAEVL